MTRRIYRVYATRVREFDEAFKEFTEILCKSDIVLKVFLVGSRARGDHLLYSDYDIVVVVPSSSDKLLTIEQLHRLRKRSFH